MILTVEQPLQRDAVRSRVVGWASTPLHLFDAEGSEVLEQPFLLVSHPQSPFGDEVHVLALEPGVVLAPRVHLKRPPTLRVLGGDISHEPLGRRLTRGGR